MRILILIVFLSILKIDKLIDKKVGYYPVIAAKFMFNAITRLNWSYGFFTSRSDNYQYLKYDIYMIDDEKPMVHEITDGGALGNIGTSINTVRLNTLIQQIARDSVILEAGSRSMALYLFNEHKFFRNIDFTIKAHNCHISEVGNRYVIDTSVDTLFDRRLSY
jgi:hypothetical protein